MKKKEHSKHYYELGRNMSTTLDQYDGKTLSGKHDTPTDCIKKAIAHLEFELEKINQEK